MKAPRVTKVEAIQRLRAAGLKLEAEQLNAWRDANKRNWGWDGWIRGMHPHAVPAIWPHEGDRWRDKK